MNRFACLAFVMVITSSIVSAQSGEEKKVADKVEALRKAMITPDKNTLSSLVADDLSYGHSSGKVEDKAAFIDELISGRSQFTSITLLDQTIKVTGSTAVVRHRLTGDTNNNNVPGKVDIFILLVWQRQKGEWKLLARQAARKPA